MLYPADSHQAGQELRLRQEYFFSAASLQDIVQRHVSALWRSRLRCPTRPPIHLNDTHPAIAVAELMRLLMDVHGIDFDKAWTITKGTFAYTNHTLLPEALESWPVPLFERLLPRHMQIIYAINAEVLLEARATGQFNDEQIRRISLIQRGRRPPRAHGQPRLRRLAFDQRRVGAAYGADEGDGVRRPSPALSRPHQQQDQRHHAAALAVPEQSRA